MASRYANPQEQKGQFFTSTDEDGLFHVTYQLSAERAQAAIDLGVRIKPEAAVIDLLTFDPEADALTIRPHATLPGREDFLQPKYARLRSITLEGFDQLGYFEEFDVEQSLEYLPTGFIKDPEYGLGLLKDLRHMVAAIETVPSVRHLVISRTRQSAIDGDTYILAYREFEQVRLGMGRIHSQALFNAMGDKRILAHNALLTARLPDEFPERHRPYRKDTIFKTVGAGVSPGRLSTADKAAAVDIVSAASRDLAKTNPEALLELQREIELVTLESLIDRMSEMVDKPLDEATWQAFFLDNPFVLTLAFGLPLAVIGDRISVGGRTFSGDGDKIVDFMHRNGLTGNITLVEIKKPATRVVASEYRGGVYSPSADLVGAVTQVLDQRYHLVTNINTLKATSRRYDLETYAVKCLVVVGRAPQGEDRLKSLELFRNSLNDVLIVTYDELIAKLRHLFEFLSPTDGL